jgi:hypothetical protein
VATRKSVEGLAQATSWHCVRSVASGGGGSASALIRALPRGARSGRWPPVFVRGLCPGHLMALRPERSLGWQRPGHGFEPRVAVCRQERTWAASTRHRSLPRKCHGIASGALSRAAEVRAWF